MSTKKILKCHWRAILWIVLILFACLLPVGNSAGTSFFSRIPNFDKIVHFGLYFVLTLSLISGFNRQFSSETNKSKIYSLIIALFLGGLVEVIQPFVGRSGELYDMLANTLGAIVAIICFNPLRWILRNIL